MFDDSLILKLMHTKLMMRWPSQIKPGLVEALVSQVDLAASDGAIHWPDDIVDSLNVLRALLGQSLEGREHMVEYDQRKERALRAGDWKFVLPEGGNL